VYFEDENLRIYHIHRRETTKPAAALVAVTAPEPRATPPDSR
jgi:hypothetical protein